MANKKQQRRRQKLKRHEYEEVYVDDEGNELPPEEAEELVVATSSRKAEKSTQKRPTNRAGRVIDPPSWRKTAKRGLLFFPLMLITVMLLGKDLTPAAADLPDDRADGIFPPVQLLHGLDDVALAPAPDRPRRRLEEALDRGPGRTE